MIPTNGVITWALLGLGSPRLSLGRLWRGSRRARTSGCYSLSLWRSCGPVFYRPRQGFLGGMLSLLL